MNGQTLYSDSRRWWIFSLIVLALGAGWTWASRVPGSFAAAGAIPNPHRGFPAPDFTLEALDGAPVSLAGQRGQVVLVNLWASWCGPCRAEMPAIQQVYDANRTRGLQVLEVNSTVQDDEVSARGFARDLGLSLPILLDRDGEVGRRYQLRSLPTSFVIDRKGVIREVILGGPISAAVLQTKLDPLLDEAP
jgi:peroxiredoxin